MVLHLRSVPRGFLNTLAGLLIIILITTLLNFQYVRLGNAGGGLENARLDHEQSVTTNIPPNWFEHLLGAACTAAPVTVVQTVTVTVDNPKATGKSKFPAGVFKAHDEDYSSLLTDADLPVLAALRNYTLPSVDPSVSSPVFTSSVHARQRVFDQLYSIGSPTGPASWEYYLAILPPGRLPPLTHIAQHYIHTHQHPSPTACKEQTRFLVLPSYRRGSGIGSIIHGVTHALSAAIRSGRVLIYDERDGSGEREGPPAMLFSGNGEDCPGKKRGMGCFFEPITSCSWSDVRFTDSEEGNANAILFRPYDPNGNKEVKHPTLGYGTRYGDIPAVLGKLLQEWEELASGNTGITMSPNARKLWWRVQGAGYLARLNPWAISRIRDNRRGTKLTRVGVRGTQTDLPMPFPLPANTFSIHVRHGDKATEMDLVPFINYLSSAAAIADANPSRGGPSKSVFLSTEDPTVIDEMLAFAALDNPSKTGDTTSNIQWTFFYTKNLPRNNGGPKTEVNTGGRVETTLMHLGELMIGLEAGSWVGTRNSNWCRLVEELAQVWVGGSAGSGEAPGVFMEVGGRGDWVDYHF
ncbi:hypothetical protein BGX38DRAFT_898284 [Terfezia claveryi]|nr:hypothetical protein BGX38DRAFT_898284 [Terfezia claveryi]